MDCEKILKLFRSELVTVNVGPKLMATAIRDQGYKAIQVEWKPLAGGDKEMQKILELLGGIEK
ncbi:MAG: hypothetical protein KBS59_03235 [Clostridiales bacterium]|nr:hypothetical protein [Clostridiales bacterium]